MWAYFADTLFAHNTPKTEESIGKELCINIFTQTWKTARGINIVIPPLLKQIQDSAIKHEVHLVDVNLTDRARADMPLWLHAKADRTKARYKIHTRGGKCLIRNHKIKTVGEAVDLIREQESEYHTRTDECECNHCVTAQLVTCSSDPCPRLPDPHIPSLAP
jgi:hypothetical protein